MRMQRGDATQRSTSAAAGDDEVGVNLVPGKAGDHLGVGVGVVVALLLFILLVLGQKRRLGGGSVSRLCKEREKARAKLEGQGDARAFLSFFSFFSFFSGSFSLPLEGAALPSPVFACKAA